MVTDGKHAVGLTTWVDTVLKNTDFFKRIACLPLQSFPYLFKMRGTLSARCSTAWRRNEISCQSNMLLPLVHALLSRHAASKQTPPYPWALRKRSKLNSISVWYSLTQYNISKQKRLHRSIFLPNWIFPADWRVCFQVLVVYFCLMYKFGFVPYTQDLKPKLLTRYIIPL